MSMGELFFIGVVILLVVPPEKLPGLARELARFWNDIRRTTSGVWNEIKKDTINPMEELRKQKAEAEEYLKLAGSSDHHSKEDGNFQPVYTPPPQSPKTDAPENATTTPAPVAATTDHKNEPTDKS